MLYRQFIFCYNTFYNGVKRLLLPREGTPGCKQLPAAGKVMKHIKILTAAALVIALLLSLCGCTGTGMESTTFAMGSVLNIRIYADEEEAQRLSDLIKDRASFVDSCLSATDENSEISRLNKNGSAKVNAYTLETMESILKVSKTLGGAVDPTIGAVSSLWGFAGDSPELPSDDEIKTALGKVGLDGLYIDKENSTVYIGEGQQIDAGAFGKGAALDEASYSLMTGNAPAVVTFGGSVLLFGKSPKGKWTVGIRDPFGTENDYFATLALDIEEGAAGFISTSGSYEKTFTENGKTYHHILSPETGYPVETDLVSVTVFAHGGMVSDALSTACFIGGLNEKTLEQLGYFSAEAVFVFKDGKYYVTDGLNDAFRLSSKDFTEYKYEG